MEEKKYPHALKKGTTLKQGAYTVDKVLGAGGFGVTYLGSKKADTVFEKETQVVVKELFINADKDYFSTRDHSNNTVIPQSMLVKRYAEFKERFKNEAETLHKFRNLEGTVNVLDYFEENETAYFTMAYIEAQTLTDVVKKTNGLSPDQALGYIKQVGEVLIALHEKNILHRDIKPDNILLDNNGKVYLIDFGIAKQYDETGIVTKITGMGTNRYAPPEQLAGIKDLISSAMDVFGLANTLYYFLTAKDPQTSDEDDLYGKKNVLYFCPNISNEINDAIEKARVKRPQDRTQSVDGFLGEISESPFINKVENINTNEVGEKTIIKNEQTIIEQDFGGENDIEDEFFLENTWYSENRELFTQEVNLMQSKFNFILNQSENSEIFWTGKVKITNKWWELNLVYDNDYPRELMGGSSIRVYVMNNDFLENNTGWRPHHLLRDTNENIYLNLGGECRVASAASILEDAIKWLNLFELVIKGKMQSEDFDSRLNLDKFMTCNYILDKTSVNKEEETRIRNFNKYELESISSNDQTIVEENNNASETNTDSFVEEEVPHEVTNHSGGKVDGNMYYFEPPPEIGNILSKESTFKDKKTSSGKCSYICKNGIALFLEDGFLKTKIKQKTHIFNTELDISIEITDNYTDDDYDGTDSWLRWSNEKVTVFQASFRDNNRVDANKTIAFLMAAEHEWSLLKFNSIIDDFNNNGFADFILPLITRSYIRITPEKISHYKKNDELVASIDFNNIEVFPSAGELSFRDPDTYKTFLFKKNTGEIIIFRNHIKNYRVFIWLFNNLAGYDL